MHYYTRQDWSTIRQQYSHIVAYGTGSTIRWDNSWKSMGYEALIDGQNKFVGRVFQDAMPVQSIEYLRKLEGKTLVVIYSIFESEITRDIDNLGKDDIDTICFKLLSNVNPWQGEPLPGAYAKNGEDMLLLNQLGRLGIEVPQFLEIGVCHPLIRNNTFLLNLLFSKSNKYRGVLVEANPLCWDLIKAYRHNDILIQGGVSPTEGEMEFYIFPNKLGFCTFNKAIADNLRVKSSPPSSYP